jgi:hypothetical protein
MKETVTQNTFIDRFDEIGRGSNFSREARLALFEYYEQLGEDCGEIEFDPIAICCDWSEYEGPRVFAYEYFADLKQCLSEIGADYDWFDSFKEIDPDLITEYLQDNTQVIEFDGGLLVMAF